MVVKAPLTLLEDWGGGLSQEDAEAFLQSKNWHTMSVAGTDQTVWDLKLANFNYAAPLDMTNISLNYDDELLRSLDAGEIPPIFVDNVRQALSTGEPGFSFNFGRFGFGFGSILSDCRTNHNGPDYKKQG